MVSRTHTLLLFLVFSLAACGPDTAPATAPTDPADPATVNFKHTDNTVRIGLRTEPVTLLPYLNTQSESRYVQEMLYQSLNAIHPQTFELVPLLAGLPDIQPEANGTVGYAYRINPDASWPNGTPITAADVVFSMKVVLNPLIANGAYRVSYEFINNIVTSPNDELRLKVVTDGPFMLAEHQIGTLPILPEYVYDAEKTLRSIRLSELASNRGAERLAESNEALQNFAERYNELGTSRTPADLVGSGPYRVASWEPNQSLALDRLPPYWAAGSDETWQSAAADRLEFTVIADANTMTTALRDELIDVATNLPIDQYQQIRDDAYLLDRYTFDAVPSLKYFGMLFNQNHPLFTDAATRRGIAQAIDVDQIIKRLFPGGLAERVTGPVLSAKDYHNDDLALIAFDPQAARQTLADAGWSDSDGDGVLDKEIDGQQRPLRFEFLIFPSATSEAVGQMIAEYLRGVGVEVQVTPKEPRALFGELNKGNFETAIIGQGFQAAPDDFSQVWLSTAAPPNGTNRSGFASQEADRLIRQINRTLDAEERVPLYERFQEIVYENQPMVFLFSPKDRVVVSRRLDFEPRTVAPNLGFNALRQRNFNKE